MQVTIRRKAGPDGWRNVEIDGEIVGQVRTLPKTRRANPDFEYRRPGMHEPAIIPTETMIKELALAAHRDGQP